MNPIFKILTKEETEELKNKRILTVRRMSKDETILARGKKTHEVGIVMDGSVRIENYDFWGNRTLLTKIGKGGIFGESYALTGEPLLVSAVSDQDSEVALIRLDKLEKEAPLIAGKILRALLELSARKNLTLSNRIFHTSPKTIKDRVLSYLSDQAEGAGDDTFEIPFTRQEMADYLNVERTALSKTLSQMKKEGLIDYRKSRFTLIRNSSGSAQLPRSALAKKREIPQK